jgi:hypothetical protein
MGSGDSRRYQRFGECGEGCQVRMPGALATEATQTRLRLDDIVADEAPHDLVDQERVSAVDEQVELAAIIRLVRRS